MEEGDREIPISPIDEILSYHGRCHEVTAYQQATIIRAWTLHRICLRPLCVSWGERTVFAREGSFSFLFAVNKDMIQKYGNKGKKKACRTSRHTETGENGTSDFNSREICRRKEYQFDAGQRYLTTRSLHNWCTDKKEKWHCKRKSVYSANFYLTESCFLSPAQASLTLFR